MVVVARAAAVAQPSQTTMAKTILIIEDEKILAGMYRDKFNQAGYKVFWASDAEEGLKLAKTKSPDLIILDILLPGENGVYFLEKLRKDEKSAEIPVIVFSNFDDPAIKKQSLALGIKNYLMKTNYNPRDIVKEVKKYLKK